MKDVSADSLDMSTKRRLRDYLDKFYVSIYRIRFLIKMHEKIAEKSAVLKNQNFWGLMQNNLILGAVVVEIFSIFDKRKGSLIKKLSELLVKNEIKIIEMQAIEAWIKRIDPHSVFRHKVLAHKDSDVCEQKIIPVSYQDFLQLVDEFDHKLKLLDKLAENPSSFYPRISSDLSSKNHFLEELEIILCSEGKN